MAAMIQIRLSTESTEIFKLESSMGRHKEALIERDELLPQIAAEVGAIVPCEIHSEIYRRAWGDGEDEACSLAAQRLGWSPEEAKEAMMEFLEETSEDCWACENLMRE